MKLLCNARPSRVDLHHCDHRWAHRVRVTTVGLEPTISGSVDRCLIHWATGPLGHTITTRPGRCRQEHGRCEKRPPGVRQPKSQESLEPGEISLGVPLRCPTVKANFRAPREGTPSTKPTLSIPRQGVPSFPQSCAERFCLLCFQPGPVLAAPSAS